jgi:inositol phosphorylceramide mannosyltransferase catalytic subunit
MPTHTCEHAVVDGQAGDGGMDGEGRIPARIIQTGPSRDLPLLRRAVVANVRLLNPDFEHRFFDDEDVERFVDAEFPQYRRVFDTFPFRIQKYDFFRYLAVYRFGGFYFDLDVLLGNGLTPLREHACVFSFEDLHLNGFLRRRYEMDWTIGNYAFGARPGHPFLRRVIDNCVRAHEDPAWVEPALRAMPRLFRDEFVVLCTTGPFLLSRTLAEHPELAADVTVLFPEDVRCRSAWHNFGQVGIHLMEGSWRKSEHLLRRRVRRLWEWWAWRKFMRQSDRLGAVRSVRRSSVAV